MTAARFTQPPVREVSLTVLFDPLGGLLAADVGSLLARLRTSYPEVTERPAMAPWGEINIPGIQILADDKVLPYSWWLSDAKNNRLIRFQFDRLVYSWRYTPNGEVYPEYPKMRAELIAALDIVESWLADTRPSTERLVEQIKRVQIDYINQIDLAPADLLCGIITGWSGNRDNTLPSTPMVQAKWLIDDAQTNPQETSVRVDSDGVDGSYLALVSSTDKNSDEGFVASLNRVHDRLEQVFLTITSEQLQNKWGRE